jgi:hypothetical protein
MQPYFKAIWRKSKVRNELIVQNVRPMIESTPLLEAPNGYARMMSDAARFRMVLVTGQ